MTVLAILSPSGHLRHCVRCLLIGLSISDINHIILFRFLCFYIIRSATFRAQLGSQVTQVCVVSLKDFGDKSEDF